MFFYFLQQLQTDIQQIIDIEQFTTSVYKRLGETHLAARFCVKAVFPRVFMKLHTQHRFKQC